MPRKFLVVILFATFAALACAYPGASHAAIVYQENDPHIVLNSWYASTFSGLDAMRYTHLNTATATFRFHGTAITWVTAKAPNMGKAQVTIDGINKGTFDLYRAAPKAHVKLKFQGLANAKHTIVIRPLGQMNPNANNPFVGIEGFIVDGKLTAWDSPKIKYNSWRGVTTPYAQGGSYRMSHAKDAYFHFSISGASFTWVTAVGPMYGKARVWIDNTDYGIVDLYAPTRAWQTAKTFANLGVGLHSVQIQVLRQKNSASTGYDVMIDAIQY